MKKSVFFVASLGLGILSIATSSLAQKQEPPEVREKRDAQKEADRASDRLADHPSVGNYGRTVDAVERLAEAHNPSPKSEKKDPKY